MLKNLGIIKGVLLTERQRKNMARRIAGKPVLEWVVRMMTDCELLDGVIVMTDDSEIGELIRRLTPIDAPVFATNALDTMECLSDALECYPAKSCVFIGADWPFMDPTLVDQLICAAEENSECDYAAYQFTNDVFSVGRPFGLFPEWYRASSLHKANRIAEGNVYRQLPGCFFLDHQERFQVELLPAPDGLDRGDLRFSCERQEDWEHVLSLYDALGNEVCEWQKLSALLKQQPQMRQQMAKLNRGELIEV